MLGSNPAETLHVSFHLGEGGGGEEKLLESHFVHYGKQKQVCKLP